MTVTIYSTPTCPFCKKAKAYLDEQGIEYTDIDVMHDQDAARAMVEKTGQMGVPVIDVDGEFVIGFDQKKLEALLSK